MSTPTVTPWVQARAEQIIALRQRHNASGQDGADMVHIIAALAAQRPDNSRQQELIAG